MAILPGSLDYLYHQGILDRIPYEAYEMTPMTPSGYAQLSGNYSANVGNNSLNATYGQMNGSQYLQQAQQGELYKTYTTDMFVPFSQHQNQAGRDFSIVNKSYGIDNQGRDVDYEVMANGKEGKKIRETIEGSVYRTKESIVNAPIFVKGLLAGGLIVTTLAMLLIPSSGLLSLPTDISQ